MAGGVWISNRGDDHWCWLAVEGGQSPAGCMSAELHQYVNPVLANGSVKCGVIQRTCVNPCIAHRAESRCHGIISAVGGGGECHQYPPGGHVSHECFREIAH